MTGLSDQRCETVGFSFPGKREVIRWKIPAWICAVVQIDFLICYSHYDFPPFLRIISEVEARSNYAVTTCVIVCFGC